MRAFITIIPDTDDAIEGFTYRYESGNMDPELLMPGEPPLDAVEFPLMYGGEDGWSGRWAVAERHALHHRTETGLTPDGVREILDRALQLAIEEVMLLRRENGWITT